jgi:putative two-component system response regulator
MQEGEPTLKDEKKILVVDDEDRNLRLMEALLAPLGYSVILAKSGLDALHLVEDEPPDLILLDVTMPGMDGFQVAERLKSNVKTSVIPIVMVTALKEVADRVKAFEVGADDFINKPVDRMELRARVKSLLKVKAYNDHLRRYQIELEEEVAQQTLELRKAFQNEKRRSLETIYRLARAAEYKDDETGAHIKRMSHYSAIIAKKMELPEGTVEGILYAAPMHDIGKIGILDRILLKPGKLNASEWDIMRQHTVIGAKILEGSDAPFIRLAEVIAMTHHEKWDGTGYPQGLKGESIPLAGRIVAIADVFDALTSKRPYKEAFSLEKAFAIIRKVSGSHFDPDVVDAFFICEKEILAIKEKYRDNPNNTFLLMASKVMEGDETRLDSYLSAAGRAPLMNVQGA